MDLRDLESVADETGITLDRRPETLSPDEFITLSRALRKRGYPRVEDGGTGSESET